MDAYYSALLRLPDPLRDLLGRLSTEFAPSVTEIHLRSGRPVTFSAGTRQLAAAQAPGLGPFSMLAAPLPHAQLQECFYSLCGHSVHSCQEELRQGFFTLPGGHRVGVAGLVHLENGQAAAFRTVTSLNLRIARMLETPLPAVLRLALSGTGGVLIIGPPGSGKTTFLRSIAGYLSSIGRKVAVVDERGELAPCTTQGFVYPVPQHCEVLSAMPKAQAIQMALRALGPEVILCDELGGEEDAAALEQGMHAGVRFVASVHGADANVLRLRPQFAALRQQGLFCTAVLLEGAGQPGMVREVCSL